MKLFLLPGLRAKRNAIRLGSLALKLILFLPLSAFSQGRTVSVTTVPFAFSANGTVLPAGDYVLYRDSENLYSLRTRNGVLARRLVLYSDSAASVQSTTKLVFRWNGEVYSLDSFWTSGSRDGMRVLNSKREKQEIAAAGNAAANPAGTPAPTVMLASTASTAIQK